MPCKSLSAIVRGHWFFQVLPQNVLHFSVEEVVASARDDKARVQQWMQAIEALILNDRKALPAKLYQRPARRSMLGQLGVNVAENTLEADNQKLDG